MDAKAKKVLAQALLLPKKSREELLGAIEDSLGPLDLRISEKDRLETAEIIDEILGEVSSEWENNPKRRKEGRVPELWRSRYYLRQGYHLHSKGSDRRDHWQGGTPTHKDVRCPSCDDNLRLLWDIDCRDSRFKKESAKVFGRLRRLPLYYCLQCPYPTIYRCTSKHKIQMIAAKGANADVSVFTDYPKEFARKRLVLKPIPQDIECLTLLSQFVDDRWLSKAQHKLLTDYCRATSPGDRWFKTRRSQLGGIPKLQQGEEALMCPFDECPTHTWGHPLFRNRRFYHMKPLATIDDDAGLEMETSAAQIVFHICWACQTVHADFQID